MCKAYPSWAEEWDLWMWKSKSQSNSKCIAYWWYGDSTYLEDPLNWRWQSVPPPTLPSRPPMDFLFVSWLGKDSEQGSNIHRGLVCLGLTDTGVRSAGVVDVWFLHIIFFCLRANGTRNLNGPRGTCWLLKTTTSLVSPHSMAPPHILIPLRYWRCCWGRCWSLITCWQCIVLLHCC